MDLRLTSLILMLVASIASGAFADDSSLARWDFGSEEATPLVSHGGVERDQAGPRPPEFPNFANNNAAVRLNGDGAFLSVADPGPSSKFDFGAGDAITLEAWVKLGDVRSGSPMYVIGKGRTGSTKFARDNQNWALRITAQKGIARLSFLFATERGAGDSHWHRWQSQSGFNPTTGWHHVAVAYRFGDADSIRGWIDSQPTSGSWDIGGATAKPPVVDDDAIWIGSSQGGSKGNSFHGWIDAVAIHRELIADKIMAKRFRRVGGPRVVGLQREVMPEINDVSEGRVLVSLGEGMPTHERWLNEGETWPGETMRWVGDEFLLPRIPLRYDEWGIRASWKAPLLVQMAADVELPPGTHSFLLRTRALSRLWIDGQVVARTKAITHQPPNGEEPITPLATPPLPGLRVVGYHQQEVIGEATIAETASGQKRRCRVVLEMIVGGKNLRTETGEVCVALQTDDGQSYVVLQPSWERKLPLTDAAVEMSLTKIESSLATSDDQARRGAAASQDDFWRQRHELARKWAREHPAPTVPAFDTTSSGHAIDSFVAAKIQRALTESSKFDEQTTQHFHQHVLPVLREHCFRCHGDKDKGGLRLDTREFALRGGDSEVPAIVPGDPAESELLARIRNDDPFERMPPTGDALSAEQIAVLEEWVRSGAAWPAPPIVTAQVALAPVVDDEAFVRRVFLDTVGVPPTVAEAEAFFNDTDRRKREILIDRLLNDERCSDHWMSYWMDLLAENPTLLNGSLNSTGPFRWFLYDAFRDNKPLDRMVTELILMRGSPHEGGSAGFAMAAENDAPFAAKGHIVASAFLGVELQCARCHDSPYHSTTQRDLYSLAAMFDRKPVTVPKTSRVPAAFFERQQRESLIRVTLKPDEQVAATWPLADVTGIEDSADIDELMHEPDDTRERLAALITAPQNTRFARVIVNRIWKRLMGAGFVEPAHDWEGRSASHGELLDWLAHQLIAHDYDARHITQLIMTSQTYQREASGRNLTASHQQRWFSAPDRRRLTAEQIVDSLHVATGTPMDVGELTFVHDGRRAISNRLTLGRPSRAWMLASLNNERDRPSLSLPRARAIADVLEAFGWSGSRQKPVYERDIDPNLLQPGVMANGTLSMTLTGAAHGSTLAQLAVDAESPQALVDALFVRVLGRHPTSDEKSAFTRELSAGFAARLVPADEIEMPKPLRQLPLVTWFNHQQSESNTIQKEVERRIRQGPPPDPRLRAPWREVYEDLVWSLFNHTEFVWIP
jgi:mono/diheme cytochrome c family protein